METHKGDIALVIRAARFAALKHKEYRRKGRKKIPYINHPIDVAAVLSSEGGVQDGVIIAGALLHDTIEDTETTYNELRGEFGEQIADIVVEVTDTKFLSKQARKRLQVSKTKRASLAARQIKLADKICNLRDILGNPPENWSLKRKQQYFDWAREVAESAGGANPELERRLVALYRRRPVRAQRRQAVVSG